MGHLERRVKLVLAICRLNSELLEVRTVAKGILPQTSYGIHFWLKLRMYASLVPEIFFNLRLKENAEAFPQSSPACRFKLRTSEVGNETRCMPYEGDI
jgi:hypothetical protein